MVGYVVLPDVPGVRANEEHARMDILLSVETAGGVAAKCEQWRHVLSLTHSAMLCVPIEFGLA
jgi:hypothetical protein